ncbi:MAG: hypothetical protein ACWGPR_12255 [Candidatus Deferrimicrobiaceae bacterium]
MRDSRAPIHLLDVWHTGQAVGSVRITSPYLHDAVVGIDMVCPSGGQVLIRDHETLLKPQDTLVFTLAGSNGAGDIEHVSCLIYYENLPGISANLITYEEMRRRLVNLYASRNTISTGTAGDYSGNELIGVEEDQMRATTEYAILGCTVQVPVHAVQWTSPDLGNLGVGMPTLVAGEGWHNSFFFADLARRHKKPLIPVFNSANKALTYVAGVVAESGTDLVISTMMGQLK